MIGSLGRAVRAGGRWTVWGRLLLLAQVALLVKRHLDLLDSAEKAELQRIVRKSKGRPSNLSRRERDRLGVLVGKLEPAALAREAASGFVPYRRPGR